MIHEGGPINISVTPTTASQSMATLYLASVISRVYTAVSFVSGVRTLAAPFLAGLTVNLTAALQRASVKGRLLWRIDASSAGSQFQAVLRGTDTASILWQSSIITVPITGATILDFGEIPLDVFRQIASVSLSSLFLDLYFAGSSLTSASFEFLLYYDFATVTGLRATTLGGTKALMTGFNDRGGFFLALPVRPTAATINTASNELIDTAVLRGTLPRYYPGTSLYVAWLRSSGIYASADQASIVATHAPLYQTLGTT